MRVCDLAWRKTLSLSPAASPLWSQAKSLCGRLPGQQDSQDFQDWEERWGFAPLKIAPIQNHLILSAVKLELRSSHYYELTRVRITYPESKVTSPRARTRFPREPCAEPQSPGRGQRGTRWSCGPPQPSVRRGGDLALSGLGEP